MTPEERVAHLTATRTVAISTAWNLFGRLFPMLIAIAATPFLLDAMGLVRWGIFSLALALMSTFGIFDIGLGRALIRTIAHAIAAGEEEEAAAAAKTGILTLAAMGVVFGVLVALGLHVYVRKGLDIPPDLRTEVSQALDVLCLALPLVVINGALWGVLAAHQKVGAYTLINLPILVLYYLGPLATLAIWRDLVPVMAVQVACRLLMTLVLWRLVRRVMPTLAGAHASMAALRPVLRLGGWMTVSNFAWPVLVYLDRFVIASVISPEATAWYSTPFDVIFRVTAMPQGVMAAAFPAMTTAHRAAPHHAAVLYRRTLLAVGTMVLPASLAAVALALPLLRLWLGTAFAEHAAPVLRLLGVGILFYSLDIVANGLVDGLGRPEFNARLALLEIAILVPLLLVLLPRWGVEGAAASWVLRVAISFFLRLGVLSRLFPESRAVLRRLAPLFLAAVASLALAFAGPLAAAMGLLASLLIAWQLGLDHAERAALLIRLRRRPA